MAGLSGRFSTMIKAKVSKLLDRAEDPSETLDYSYEKQLELLQNVKKGIADVVTAKKRLQLQSQKLEQSVVKLDTQARQALASGNEELARTALERKTAIQTELQGLDQQVTELEAQQQQLIDKEAQMRAAHRRLPVQEGGHQGAVLRRRGAGADLRGRQRRRRGDGRRRAGDAARRRQDREHEGARRGRRGARGRGHVRRHHAARRRQGRHRPPARAADVHEPGRRRAGEDEGRARRRARAAAPASSRRARRRRPAALRDRRASRRRASTSSTTTQTAKLNELDNAAVEAVDAGDEARFQSIFDEMLALVRAAPALDGDELSVSDVILPPPDLTFTEAGASSPAKA